MWVNAQLTGNVSHVRHVACAASPGARAATRTGREDFSCLPGRPVRSDEMFERFTDRARRGVVLAQEKARMLNHNYIGTEHVLLGLIPEGEGAAAKVLELLGSSLEAVRPPGGEVLRPGQPAPAGDTPLTPP